MAERKTRYFILAAAVVLVGGLCTGLIAYYRGDLSSSVLAQAGGQDDLRYVPDAASVVGYADVRAVMSSEFRQRMKKLERDSPGKNRFRDETGIDIERDVDSVVGCLLSGEGGSSISGGFAVLRGRFDVQRIEAAATEHGATIVMHNGRQLYLMSDDGPRHGDRLAFGFMEDGALLVGQEPAVKLAIDRADSGASGPSSEDVMRLIDEASAQATVWAVGSPEGLAAGKLPGPVAAQVPQIKWFSATSRLNGGMAATLRAETIDEAAAKNLRDAVTGMAALARMSLGNRQEWQQVLQSLQIGGEGTTVSMSLTLPLAAVDYIANEVSGHKPHMPPMPPAGAPPPPAPPPPPPAPPRL
ncbi:MAG: hypothetical protein GEV06_08495 [Luteitalea sp.]|nr:hypothetical protein [Luteitalea sp.]